MAAQHDALLIATMQHRRNVLAQALERAGWSLHVYQDVAQALDHIRERPYSAIFCDEYLRGASAGGFLAWSRRLHPDIPFFVVAVQGDEASLGVQQRPDRVLAFPPSDADLPRPVTASMWDGPPAMLRDLPMEGSTSLVRLPDLIEMLALTGASAVIALGEGRIGRVYLNEGRLEHAVSVDGGIDTIGVRGLGLLLEREDVPFQVLPYRVPSRRTIHVSTAAALTEGSRLIDEGRRDRRLLEDVRSACPDLLGVAVGYLLNEAPNLASGDGATAYAKGLELVEVLRPVAGSVSHLSIETEGHAHAAVIYGRGSLLAAHAPRGRSLVLLSALAKAVKQHAR